MKSKAIIPMLVGVGIGLLAIKLGWNYIEQNRLSAQASQGDTAIVLAGRNIAPGTPLELDDLKVAQWPRSTVPSQAFSDTQELVGRVNLTPLSAELPVLENMLTPPGTAPGLPALIPAGYQAMTVKVDEFAGVGGFLKRGDQVDVVATFNVKRTKSGSTDTVTRAILRDITVCAVGQEIQPDENNEPMIVRSVTLLVKPEQAQRLSLASTRGTIRLSLRSGQSSDSASALPAIDFSTLLSSNPDALGQNGPSKGMGRWMKDLLAPAETAEPQPAGIKIKVDPHWSMQIIKGVQTEEIIFENSRSSRRIDPNSPPQDSAGNVQEFAPANQDTTSQWLDEPFDQQEAGQ